MQCDVRDPQAVSQCIDTMESLTGLPDVSVMWCSLDQSEKGPAVVQLFD